FADVDAIGARPVFENGAHGIGQRGDLANGFGKVFDARGGEGEAFDLMRGQLVGAGGFEVAGGGRRKRLGGRGDELGEAEERGVLAGGRGRGEHEGRGTGALSDGSDGLDKVGGHGGTPRGA